MRVALVSVAPISPHLPYHDGFRSRYQLLLEILAADHDVLLVYLEDEPERFAAARAIVPPGVELAELPVPSPPRGRAQRLVVATRLRVTGSRASARWERRLGELLRSWRTDVVVGAVRTHWQSLRTVATEFHTVLLAEEDAASDPGVVRRTSRGRALRAFELSAAARTLDGRATWVVISPREAPWARGRFPRSDVRVVPHAVDAAHWGADVEPAAGITEHDVFVLGHMGHLRNALGLRDITDALARLERTSRPRLLVASSSEPHEILADLPPGIVHWLGPVEDPRPYFHCRATLVPSFAVTGAKTTILEAWAAGCAVVTTTQAAASVGGDDGVELLAGDDPHAVADALVRVLADEAMARALVDRAHARLATHHSRAAVRAALSEALVAATAQPRRVRIDG